MNELDIASFAESLVTEEVTKGKPVQFAAAQAPDAPDISEVEVGHDFAAQVLSEGNWAKAEIDVKEIPTPPPAPKQRVEPIASINEQDVYKRHLVKEYKKKVQDLQELVDLMEEAGVLEESVGTTVGMIGTSMVGSNTKPVDPFKKKKRKTNVVSRLNKRRQK